MRIAAPPRAAPGSAPPWPPLLATAGPGGSSLPHAHHAMHLIACRAGELRVRAGASGPWSTAAGVLTRPDVPHAIDARGAEVLLVFIDPESDAGEALRALVPGPARLVSAAERDALLAGADPADIMGAGGIAWSERVVRILGGVPPARRPAVHPRVRKVLGLLRSLPPHADTSLDALAAAVGLSPSRLMHAFTESIGLPLRPYLGWLRLQRAAAAIAAGVPLAEAAAAAGFADSAHMTRTFRRMLGTTPSALRSQPVRSRQSRGGAA